MMKYCVHTWDCGLLLKPDVQWDGSSRYEFVIMGKSDSNFATDLDSRKSISGWSTLVAGALVLQKSKQQEFVGLSVMEADDEQNHESCS